MILKISEGFFSLDAYRAFRSWSFILVAILRSIFFLLLAFTFNHFLNLGTSLTAINIATTAGVALASFLAFSRLKTLGVIASLILLYICTALPISLFQYVPFFNSEHLLSLFSFQEHLFMFYLSFSFGMISTWAFWRFRDTITVEILLLAFIVLQLFAGHRNYHLDVPRLINSLAWSFGIDELYMLVTLGMSVVGGLLLYVFLATIPSRPIPSITGESYQFTSGSRIIPRVLLSLILLIGILYLVATQTYSHYNTALLSRIANGVGDAKEEGLSPLGFHSALGGTSQPSALVRLEGDYSENPFSPMLYLRESALSEFNGHELVIADSRFDQDVPRIQPEEAFVGKEDPRLLSRVPLVHSIYLLADHKTAFAVDYPVTLTPLKNPNPKRFKGAYKAYSIVPGFNKRDISTSFVGDPNWSEEVKAHYTKKHTDIRYQDLADKITSGVSDQISKAYALADYLTENAIYTLTPNHQVGPDEDPVAPFLFGDKRGYCVHFAHAVVYMMRALGIPARIGTGYLTDLSQSKDGHILLRMSDRHAWAETYINGLGWIPFDVQPKQVESHAETDVDMKVLEELMDSLGPDEEIIPNETIKNEPLLEDRPDIYIPDYRLFIIFSLLVAALLLLIKIYLRYGWLLPGAPQYKLKRSYISLASSAYDLGIGRNNGETRLEFARRLQNISDLDIATISSLLVKASYSPERTETFSVTEITQSRDEWNHSIKNLPYWRRILGSLNPASVFAFITRRGW